MRIFCLCVVKNEEDVLEECITAAARWADGIFIADNGSDDGTPAIIARLVSRFPNVFDAGAITEPFTDDMRGKIFRRVGQVSTPGDWWCKLDADEFFIDDPRAFLAALPKETDTVWGSFYTFYFTEDDLRRYERSPEQFRTTPLVDRLEFYKNNESEIRFVKHANPWIWKREWPKFRCAAYPRRIRVAHYRYRSPEQISRRLEVRRRVAARTRGSLFPHEMGSVPKGVAASVVTAQAGGEGAARPDYLERVVPSAGLDRVAPGKWVAREKDLRAITDVWPETIPFWIWKPYRVVRSTLSLKRVIPTRVKRLFYGRR